MKKLALLLVLLALVLTGCADETGMYVGPAQLNDAERAIADLLKRPASHGPLMLDFSLDDTVRTITLTGYELVEGEWQPVLPGSSLACEAAEGRMALDFDILPEGLGVYITGAEESGSSKSYHDADSEMDMTGLSRLTSVIADRTTVEYEVEIPIVMQVFDGGNATYSLDMSDFAAPEAIAQRGYAHVYALTVTFSRDPLE